MSISHFIAPKINWDNQLKTLVTSTTTDPPPKKNIEPFDGNYINTHHQIELKYQPKEKLFECDSQA